MIERQRNVRAPALPDKATGLGKDICDCPSTVLTEAASLLGLFQVLGGGSF